MRDSVIADKITLTLANIDRLCQCLRHLCRKVAEPYGTDTDSALATWYL